MLKWSQAVLLAFHAMAFLASREDEVIKVDEIAKSLDVSSDHLSKVLQRLGKSNFATSVRGPAGGYKLACDPKTVSLLDIYECVEGSFSQRDCMLHDPGCGSGKCIFGSMMCNINSLVRKNLSDTILSDVAEKLKSSGKVS